MSSRRRISRHSICNKYKELHNQGLFFIYENRIGKVHSKYNHTYDIANIIACK